MSELLQIDAYGTLVGEYALQMKRSLAGPIERVWAYLTESDLRRQWFAAGDMRPGERFELTWRNHEFTDDGASPPDGMPEEHSMPSEVIEFDPPRRLVIAWRNTGNVTFELEERGSEVLLTLTHQRFAERSMLIKHAAGWHAHLDVLGARTRGERPQPFWDRWQALAREYEARIPE